ncbi:hypothetical protein ACFYPZ_24655 [Streptomyces sp. NPDC005506]|uniref:hypothetical protein n=1 Tax=Streptomyces sp. NPDC005506 TaxID=3364718 RepID=UPI0036CD3FAC
MSIADPWERYIVGHDSRKVQQVQVRERIDGVDIVETVTTKPLQVYDKRPDGSLVELFGEAKTAALDAFWEGVERFNEEQENDR